MIEFWTANKRVIIYVLIVICVVLILRFFTKLFHNILEKRSRKKHPNETPETIQLTRKILNSLWLVLGIMALVFIFIDKENYKVFAQKFYIVFYIGIVAVATITTASLTQTWFKRSIAIKIKTNEDPTS